MMQRRDFLRLSLSAAIATLGSNLRAALRPMKRPVDFDLSIAFSGDDSILGGDAAFLPRDATIRILSFQGPYAADVDAIYMAGGVPLRFRAGSTRGAPARFNMPVDPIDGLRFEIRPHDGEPIPLRMSVNSGATPLRRGKYVIAVHERTDRFAWDTTPLTALTMLVDYREAAAIAG
jgi:hypothetical protein